MIRVLAFLVIFFQTNLLWSQTETVVDTESWWGFMTSGQIAPNWSLWVDTHHVPDLFLIVRGGATYHTENQRLAITAGYAGLKLSTRFSDGKLIRGEHRPWGQIIYRVPSTKPLSLSVRFRYDQRYKQTLEGSQIVDGYDLNHRLRFNASLRYNFGNKLSPHFNFSNTLFNESLITTGPAFIDVPFEHRVFYLFSFARKNVVFSPGYHVRFITTPTNLLRINHGFVLWINLNYRFKDFRRPFLKEFPTDRI